MEVRQLEGFVLLLVMLGMIIGVGVLVLDKFGIAVKDSTIVQDENVTVTSGAGTTTNDDVTSIQGCYDAINITQLIVDSECNLTGSTGIIVNGSVGNSIVGLFKIHLQHTCGYSKNSKLKNCAKRFAKKSCKKRALQ